MLWNNKTAGLHYKCKCDCETITYIHGNNLRHGRSLSCGCYAKERASEASFIDLSGKTYGMLTVISRAPDRIGPSGSHTTMWNCKCSCGKNTVVAGNALTSGRQISCGCAHKKPVTWIDGTVFESEKELYHQLHVEYNIVSRRMRDGWNLKEAVITLQKECNSRSKFRSSEIVFHFSCNADVSM